MLLSLSLLRARVTHSASSVSKSQTREQLALDRRLRKSVSDNAKNRRPAPRVRRF
jgi:hypothetical protein